ncbi:MAG: Cys-tRNA(Pro) deacylase [Desulfovibrionaceae bacterium]|nr:Cys-tRNA(Pro) deacylase [Desulfovibrionaceae bacterium]
MKIAKTNAARLLDKLGINYEMHQTEVDLEDLSATTMAANLGENPEQVFKTLVCRGDKEGVLMACIPADQELDLKALALASGNKHVEMVHLKEVLGLTGYVRGGCSPLAAKKNYPVYLDESAILYDTIFISAGLRGVQLELKPEDLAKATYGTFVDLTRHN